VCHSAGKISSSPEIKSPNPVGTKVLIKIPPFQESVLQKWQRLVRALGALGFLFCGLAGQSAYADGSVSSLHSAALLDENFRRFWDSTTTIHRLRSAVISTSITLRSRSQQETDSGGTPQ
jgi:hypothetical protein